MAAPFTFPKIPPTKPLSLEQARAAIKDAVEAFDKPENLAKMLQAKEQAGEDPMKLMLIVLPVAMLIQQSVIEKYGYASNQQGILEFSQAIGAHQEDSEVGSYTQQLRDKFMPKFQNPK